MKENEVQAAKYEDRYSFREVNRHDFNDHILFMKKNYKLMNSNQIIYYSTISGNRVVAKVDSLNRKFYLTRKTTTPIDNKNNKL